MKIQNVLVYSLMMAFVLVGCSSGGEGGGSPVTVTIDCGGPDSDGDKLPDCYEKFLGTSIQDDDTDGDNLSDYDEIVTKAFDADTNNYQFNPLIADVPQLSFELTSVPDISVKYTNTQEQSISNTTTMGTETASITTTSETSTESVGVEVSETSGVSFSLDDFGGSYSATVSQNWEQSFSWTKEQSFENRRTYEQSVAATSSSAITQTGGEIALTLKVKNRGFQVVTLTNLSLSAVETDPRDSTRLSAIGTLDFDTRFGSFPEIDIEPNRSSSGTLIFRRDLSLGKALDLLQNSDNLIIEAASWQAKDADGRSFTQNLTNIGAKNATVVIDFGPRAERKEGRRKESYFVATTADFENKRITVATAMRDILKIPYTTGTAPWNGSPAETFMGLTSVRGVGTDKEIRGHWTALYVFTSNNGADRSAKIYDNLKAAYDFDTLELRKGYILHLVYVEDMDGDGIAAREEFLHGTSDEEADSDKDGLSDFDEIKTGWEIPLTKTLTRKVFSDPLEADADDDTLEDGDEFLRGTDPFNNDTDGDGLRDANDTAVIAAEMYEKVYLPLNGSLLDESGNGKNGIMDAPSYVRDRKDRTQSALYLDGTTGPASRMELTGIFSGTQKTGAAWSLWVRPETLRNQGILSYLFSGSLDPGEAKGAARLWTFQGGGVVGQGHESDPIFGNGLDNTTNWVHLVGVIADEDNNVGAETFRLYANGELIRKQVKNTCCYVFGGEVWKFGVDASGTFDREIPDGAISNRFQGYLDDIRIFARALSGAEVRALTKE